MVVIPQRSTIGAVEFSQLGAAGRAEVNHAEAQQLHVADASGLERSLRPCGSAKNIAPVPTMNHEVARGESQAAARPSRSSYEELTNLLPRLEASPS